MSNSPLYPMEKTNKTKQTQLSVKGAIVEQNGMKSEIHGQ